MAKKNVAENKAFRIPSALIVVLVLVVGIVLAVVMLYPVAREYYVAVRNNEQLNAEYQALLERNQKIQDQIDELQTPIGIEDHAREEFGWVKEGEEAVNITGLNITDSSTKLPSAIEPGSIEAPEHWWTQTLDEFFDVEKAQRENPYPDDTIPGL
jgi:cell division protein FtsB